MADDPPAVVAAEAEIDADTLWRLATRGLSVPTARSRATTCGDTVLTSAVLNIVSIVWEPSA